MPRDANVVDMPVRLSLANYHAVIGVADAYEWEFDEALNYLITNGLRFDLHVQKREPK